MDHIPAFLARPAIIRSPVAGSQKAAVLEHIRRNGSISCREAFMNLNEMTASDLRKYITRLRKDGFSISAEAKRNPVTGKRYTRYSLAHAKAA
mgnify:CR=1 FL=1